MQITVLCNAGLALVHNDAVLLVDVPNDEIDPFCVLKDEFWCEILKRNGIYKNLCGLYFTHEHPDHYSKEKVERFAERWPEIPICLPDAEKSAGCVRMGPFSIEYRQFDHAPMDVPIPTHVVSMIKAGDTSVYVAGDAKLDADAHADFIGDACLDAAFWNSMYLSRPQTRELLEKCAKKNYIYHMPEGKTDSYGLWAKCVKNIQRYGNDLQTVTVIDRYPYTIE